MICPENLNPKPDLARSHPITQLNSPELIRPRRTEVQKSLQLNDAPYELQWRVLQAWTLYLKLSRVQLKTLLKIKLKHHSQSS